MTFSGHIKRTATPAASNYSKGRNNTKIDHIVLHHGATTSGSVIEQMMVTASRKVSATYVVYNNGDAIGMVPEEHTPFTNGNLPWNRRSVTFEIANESAGGAWPVSAAATETVAQIVADVCRRHGIPVNRDRILGHRELYTRHKAGYATACPGGLDLDGIVRCAAELLGQPAPAPSTGSGGGGAAATGTNWATLQIAVDGNFGPQSIRKLQYALGYRTAAYLDGVFGPVTKKKLQAKLGQVQDGHFGPVSTKALQRHLGTVVDGNWGPVTTRRLQERLNAGTF